MQASDLEREGIQPCAGVAYNVLKRRTQNSLAQLICYFAAIMPLSSGSLSTASLLEILRALVQTKQTGYLKIKDDEREGFLAVENGAIVNARAGAASGLHAFFQFVSWRDVRMEFHERPMPIDLARDLESYDPFVLLSGMSAKVDELTAHQAKNALAAAG